MGAATIAPDADLFAALEPLDRDDRCGLPVVDDGRLHGLVARHDVLRALVRIRHDREASAVAPIDLRLQRRAAPRE